MEAYLFQVHNLNNKNGFSDLASEAKSAIISYYTASLNDISSLENIVEKESNREVLDYIKQYLDLRQHDNSIVFTTKAKSYIENVDFNNLRAVIDFNRFNNIQNINGILTAVNALLPDGGIYIGRLETYWERKLKIYNKFGRQLGRLLWLSDFAINRIIPRIPYLESVYSWITNSEFHCISRAEISGRLVFHGFEIIDFKVMNGLSYFVVMKTGEPYKLQHPSYYPIIKLNRIGQHGKIIGVYKLRTMNPYSEFIQDYVIKMNGYNDKGKPAGDFRLTRWGKIFRRLWIDELPQLVNVLKGEMKLVGLRPLSQVRYNQFPEELKKERINYKPGCVPPYVALKMPDDKMNIEAERIYIKDLSEHPHTTDIRYFLKAVYNILANKIRSS